MERTLTQQMNGKPVRYVPAKSVLNLESGFRHKLLCDGLTFTAGSACAYSCTFCYVPDLMRKSPHLKDIKVKHHEVVIRREGAIDALRRQLTTAKGVPKFKSESDQRVLYMSPLVDVAANMELVNESIEACRTILDLTHWHIRLLSKSNMLSRIAIALQEYRSRLIFGVSTGTREDGLTKSFEQNTALVSARLKSLYWLQDNGFRTYGMICPSLPQHNYWQFSHDMYEAIRGERCEHVWAECMNARGESFTRTLQALNDAGYTHDANRLQAVTEDPELWEDYSRRTFEAHAKVFTKPGQLRFLQYVNKASRPWWEARKEQGAICL